MTFTSVLHLVLHAAVPGVVAWFFFRKQWRRAWIIMLATMLVDLDHLLADPIYDPNRCGIGFHPLHTAPAIAVYVVLAVLPPTRLVGVGLVVHMALDLADCGVQRGLSLLATVRKCVVWITRAESSSGISFRERECLLFRSGPLRRSIRPNHSNSFVSPFFHETALQMKSQSASRATNQGLMPADTSAQ